MLKSLEAPQEPQVESTYYELSEYEVETNRMLGLNTIAELEAEIMEAGFYIDEKRIVTNPGDDWGDFWVEFIIGDHSLTLHCVYADEGPLVSVDFTYASMFESAPTDLGNYHAKSSDVELKNTQPVVTREGIVKLGEAVANACRNILYRTPDTMLLVQASTPRKGRHYSKIFKGLIAELDAANNLDLRARFQEAFHNHKFARET